MTFTLADKPRCKGCLMPSTPMQQGAYCTDCRVDMQFGGAAGAAARAEDWIDPDDRRDFELSCPGVEPTHALVYGTAS